MKGVRELIIAKRDGQTLSPAELKHLIAEYTAGRLPDYQMSALLMAITIRGMNTLETCSLLEAMIESGVRMGWQDQAPRPIADKHSTGGVGDKTSFIVLPLLIAAGCSVPMIAGRGLGHTGGTLDKLEALEGATTTLSVERMRALMNANHGFLGGQTADLAPADKLMYALRDVTGTVESVPLIVSSILSKKLASGVKHLVMDVKTGDGAFMRTEADATILAQALVDVSARYGAATTAVVTDMNTPLGHAMGNALEIAETLDILEGKTTGDVLDLSLDLAAALLCEIRGNNNRDLFRSELENHLRSGRAREIFFRIATGQGAKISQLERTDTSWLLGNMVDIPIEAPRSEHSSTVYLSGVKTRALGTHLAHLGAGRLTKESIINPRTGVWGLVPIGTALHQGDPIAFLRVPKGSATDVSALLGFFEFSDAPSLQLRELERRQRSRCLAWFTPKPAE